MLGLGAGSVARLLRAFDHRAQLVAVEIAPSIVEIARREFELDTLDIEIVIADAHNALRRDDARYDLVIEDIFVDRQGVAQPSVTPSNLRHLGGDCSLDGLGYDESGEADPPPRDRLSGNIHQTRSCYSTSAISAACSFAHSSETDARANSARVIEV